MAGSSAVLGSLVINVGANIAPFTAGIGKAKSVLGGFSSSLNNFSSGLGTAALAATGLAGVLGAHALGHSLVSGLEASIEAFAEDERQAKLLESQLEATGNTVGFTAEELRTFADELQQVTRFSHEATTGAEKLLLSFRSIKGDTFKDTVKAIQNVTAIRGGDLSDWAVKIGKALENPAKGMTQLARAGVVLSEVQKTQIKDFLALGQTADAQRVILDALNHSFGNAAQADAQTYSGRMEQMKNAMTDLKEEVGGGIAPTMTSFAKSITIATHATSEFLKLHPALKRQLPLLLGPTGILFDQHGKPSKPAAAAEKKGLLLEPLSPDEIKMHDDDAKRAAHLFDEMRTPAEKYRDTMKDVVLQYQTGFADLRTFTRAAMDAHKELDKLNKVAPVELKKGTPVEFDQRPPEAVMSLEMSKKLADFSRESMMMGGPSQERAGAHIAGTLEAYSASQRGRGTNDPMEKLVKSNQQVVEEAKKSGQLLNDNNQTLKSIDSKLLAVEVA